MLLTGDGVRSDGPRDKLRSANRMRLAHCASQADAGSSGEDSGSESGNSGSDMDEDVAQPSQPPQPRRPPPQVPSFCAHFTSGVTAAFQFWRRSCTCTIDVLCRMLESCLRS